MSLLFTTECIATNKRNPLELDERITVIQMADENYCEHDMYVDISWNGKNLAIPFAKIKPLYADEDPAEAIDIGIIG